VNVAWAGGRGSFGDVSVLTGNGGPQTILGGTVPAGTAKVGVRAGKGAEVRARLADSDLDPFHRFYGAIVSAPPGAGFAVTAYAADGHALGRWVSA
jgi:hypothetical protein